MDQGDTWDSDHQTVVQGARQLLVARRPGDLADRLAYALQSTGVTAADAVDANSRA